MREIFNIQVALQLLVCHGRSMSIRVLTAGRLLCSSKFENFSNVVYSIVFEGNPEGMKTAIIAA